MSKRRPFVAALLLSLGATFLATSAQSHTGTDKSQGCHTDRKTGEYHCHTPTKPDPEMVTLTYCHVVRGGSNCGHTRDACWQLVSQLGGSCETQLSFGVR